MLSVIMLSIVMMSVIMLSVAMLNVIMLSVIMLSVFMLSVVMLSVIMLNVFMLRVNVGMETHLEKKKKWYQLMEQFQNKLLEKQNCLLLTNICCKTFYLRHCRRGQIS
jgi:hypothetical protein